MCNVCHGRHVHAQPSGVKRASSALGYGKIDAALRTRGRCVVVFSPESSAWQLDCHLPCVSVPYQWTSICWTYAHPTQCPLILCCTSHIVGGEQPPYFMGMRRTACACEQ